jgi:hypothetical protein
MKADFADAFFGAPSAKIFRREPGAALPELIE